MRIRKKKEEEARAKRGLAYWAMISITTIIATFQYGPRLYSFTRNKFQPVIAKHKATPADRRVSSAAHSPA
jgi:hypothetical protein